MRWAWVLVAASMAGCAAGPPNQCMGVEGDRLLASVTVPPTDYVVVELSDDEGELEEHAMDGSGCAAFDPPGPGHYGLAATYGDFDSDCFRVDEQEVDWREARHVVIFDRFTKHCDGD